MMPPRRLIRLVSIAIHVVIVGWVMVAQLLDLGPLPAPRVALAFERVSIARPIDIPLPPPRQGASPSPRAEAAAPIAPPPTIAPDNSVISSGRATNDATVTGGVERSVAGGIDGLGASEIRALPPAPSSRPQAPVRVHS